MKHALSLALLVLVAAAGFGQQQFAKTGVVNIPLINQAYKAAVTKAFEAQKAAAQKDLQKLKDEIQALTDQRADAVKKNDTAKVQTLDTQLQAKKDAFAEVGKKKQDELAAAAEALKVDTTLQKLLPQEIEQAARSKGFALILNSANPSVIWWAVDTDTDITVEVANRLSADTGLTLEIKAAGTP